MSYCIVATEKETNVRKSLVGGFETKDSAEKKLLPMLSDSSYKKKYRYMKVAKENYKQRMGGEI